jgi:uncharacterized protein
MADGEGSLLTLADGVVTVAVLTMLGLVLLIDQIGRVVAVRIALPIFESSPPFQIHPLPPDDAAESLRITTPENQTLAAALFQPVGSPRGLVLFCPEFGADRWSAPAYCAGLIERGFVVLSCDFRSQGDSDPVRPGYRPIHWVTTCEVDDVRAVLRWIKSEARLAKLPLFLFGVSRGGGAAIAAARTPEVRAVITDGAFSPRTMMMHFFYRWARLYIPDWLPGLLPRWYVAAMLKLVELSSGWQRGVRYVHLERILPRLRHTPILMISGERDSYCLPRFTYRLQKLTRQDRQRAWIVPAARHNEARKLVSKLYDDRLAEFLDQAGALPAGEDQVRSQVAAAIPTPHFSARPRPTEAPSASGESVSA